MATKTATKTAKVAKKTSRRMQDLMSPNELWAKLKNGQAEGEKNYSIKENYLLNDRISHPAFGVGFVRQILEFHRLEVLFEDKARVLVQNKVA